MRSSICRKFEQSTWDVVAAAEGGERFAVGLNLTVFGLMAVMAVASVLVLGREGSIEPARSFEKDLKLKEDGLEATGFAITVLSESFISLSELLIAGSAALLSS